MQASLTQGSVARHIRDMTVPMVWAILAMMSFGAADTFFVGQLGPGQLAAMSFTFPLEMVFTSIAIGVGAGVSSSLARLIGAGDVMAARNLVTDGLFLAAGCSVLFAILGASMITETFALLGAAPELMPFIREYLHVWYWGVPALISSQICMASLRALGLSRTQGYIVGATALLNIALDPLLIFGLAGLPRMELEGAALATALMRYLTLLVGLYVVGVRLQMLAPPQAHWTRLKMSWGRILHVGIPAIGTNMIIPLASGIVVILVAKEGSEAVAGFGVAARIEPLALVVFYALSSVAGPIFGQNSAAGEHQRLQLALQVITRFCLVWGVFVAGILFIFGKTIVSWFSDSEQVQSVAYTYLLIVPVSYGAYGIVMSVNAAFNGMGTPMPALMISTSRVLLVYIPLALLGRYLWGINGLFAASAISNLLLGAWAYRWLRHHIRILALRCEANTTAASNQA